MKRLFHLIVAAVFAIALLAGCQKYDDSDLRRQLQELREKLQSLEAWCSSSQSAIDAVAVLQEVVKNMNSVASIDPFIDADGATGYVITFTNKQTIKLYNGKDGDTFFGNVVVNDDCIVFTLADGRSFTVPRRQEEHGPSIGTYLWADNVYELGNNGASILADMYSKTHINRVILLVKGSTGRMAFLANPNKEYVQSDYEGRDILQEVIDAMHAKDIKVFAWLYCNEDYTYLSFYPEEASYHFYYGLSDSVVDVNSDSFCGYLSRLVKTIGDNYQVDGFMFDHIRYNACYYGWGKKDFLAMTSDPEIGMTLGEYNEAVKLLAETYDYSIAKDEDGRYVHNGENPEIEEYKANAIYDAALSGNAAIVKLMKYRELSIDKMCYALSKACNGRPSIVALMPEVVTSPAIATLAYGVTVNDTHIFDYNTPMLYSSDFNENAKWVGEGCRFLLSHNYPTQPSLQAYRPGGETSVLAADIEACKKAGCPDYNLFQSFTYDIARITMPEKNVIRIAYLKATESPVGTVKVNLSDASKLIDVSFNGVFSGGQYTLNDNVLTVSGENFTKVGDEGIIQLKILDGASVTSVESSRIVWMDAD